MQWFALLDTVLSNMHSQMALSPHLYYVLNFAVLWHCQLFHCTVQKWFICTSVRKILHIIWGTFHMFIMVVNCVSTHCLPWLCLIHVIKLLRSSNIKQLITNSVPVSRTHSKRWTTRCWSIVRYCFPFTCWYCSTKKQCWFLLSLDC